MMSHQEDGHDGCKKEEETRDHVNYLLTLGLGVRHLRSNDSHGKYGGLEFGIPYTAITERRVFTAGVSAVSG